MVDVDLCHHTIHHDLHDGSRPCYQPARFWYAVIGGTKSRCSLHNFVHRLDEMRVITREEAVVISVMGL